MFTKTKLFTYLGITIKKCANRSVNYNYINKHYTYADSIYYCSVCIMSQFRLFVWLHKLLYSYKLDHHITHVLHMLSKIFW